MPTKRQPKPKTSRPRGIARAANLATVNQAAAYGVRVIPTDAPAGATYWQVTSVRHLSPQENQGRHNIFVDALDETGQRCRDLGLRIGWSWEGRRPDEPADPKPLDKPDNEPAGNVDVYKGQLLEVWLQGDGLSADHVANLHTDHDDEPGPNGETWNSRGHHSFHLIFQRARKEADTNGNGGPPPATLVDDAVYVPGFDAIQDGTTMQPGQHFAQSWRMRNTGTTAWAFGYELICVDNQLMGAPARVQIPACPPGAEVAVTVPFIAPSTPGSQRSTWQLSNAQGQPFGQRIWTEINVVAAGGAELGGDQLAPPAGEQIALSPGVDPTIRLVANIWNRYGSFISRQAVALGLDPGVALAVLAAESAGEAFGDDGRMIIRFENHIFDQQWGQQNPDRFNQYFRYDAQATWKGHQWRPTPADEWRACHSDQATEWAVLTLARSLNDEAALSSISMGAPQIMGFNHTAIGYATAPEMFTAFQADVRNQLASLFRFMQVNQLVDAVRQGNFLAFATGYNGGGQPEVYRDIIQRNLTAWQSLQATGRGLAPAPTLPPTTPPTAMDPELYAAWRRHVLQGLENNQVLFGHLLNTLTLLTQSANRSPATLDRSLQLITWLSIIYNTYWTRLAYLGDPATAQQTLVEITDQAIAQIKELIERG